MVRPVLAAALLLAGAAAFALDQAEPPLSVVTETQEYPTADEAATVALKLAMPLSDDYEYGGFVVARDGKFFYSDPVSNERTGHIAFRAGVPKGAKMVAIYHTHPSDEPDSRLFSWDDVKEAKDLDVNSYIGVLGDRTIRFFDPRRTPTRSYEVPGSKLSPGKVSDGVILATIINR